MTAPRKRSSVSVEVYRRHTGIIERCHMQDQTFDGPEAAFRYMLQLERESPDFCFRVGL